MLTEFDGMLKIHIESHKFLILDWIFKFCDSSMDSNFSNTSPHNFGQKESISVIFNDKHFSKHKTNIFDKITKRKMCTNIIIIPSFCPITCILNPYISSNIVLSSTNVSTCSLKENNVNDEINFN